MEEDQELRYVCKLCNKKYPCGKSLGGHMRSHVIANSSAELEEKVEPNMRKIASFAVDHESKVAEFVNGGQSSNYGLRENPRKTWRAVDSTTLFPLPTENTKICKQCGKGFQSMKALCGHMACHSDKGNNLRDDQYSWTSENQNSDSEAENRIGGSRSSSKGKRFKKLIVKYPFSLTNNNNNNGSNSSASEIDGEEQEEVAMCLMLLSRDSGNNNKGSVVESSDNNSVILETTKSSSIDMRSRKMEAVKMVHNDEEMKTGDVVKSKDGVFDEEIANSDSGYFLDECAKAESDVSVDGFKRNNSAYRDYEKLLNRSKSYRGELRKELKKEKNEYDNGRIESRKRRHSSEKSPEFEVGNISQKKAKYECFNCKKIFKSYQALGGHRPCHKRSNAYYESRYDSSENSLEDSTEFVVNTGKKIAVESGGNRKPSGKNNSSHIDKRMKGKKSSKGHVCPFCDRVFKNGQALGGHKRSHFIGGGGHEENNAIHRSPVRKPDLLDLNLPPATQEDEEWG